MEQKRKNRIRVIVCLLILCIIMGNKSFVRISAEASDKMQVHYIDVGESDAILVQSGSKNMLIDAGDTDDKVTVVDYLKKQKVKKLDYVICTHPHADHIGGMAEVIKAFQIGKIIMPKKAHTTKTFEELLSAIKSKKLKATNPIVGDVYKLGTAKFTIIAPNHYKYGDNLNNYSVGIRLVHGKNSFVFTGDAEVEAEHDMAENGKLLASDVLKLGHHGSVTCSTKVFLDAVKPKYAVISVGPNSYGHPSDKVVSDLLNRGVKIFRTDKQGTIVASSNGKKITFNCKPLDPASAKGLSKKNNNSDNSRSTKTIKKSSSGIAGQDTAVYITKTGKTYHVTGCRYLKDSKIKTTLKTAKSKKLTACSVCDAPN